ncbi:hypothetical protein CSUB01_07605 [Colletotrichum sublineola]|uniref:Uncharacterized protein n=1 Tax=Colletotrichum sublineola TaxID=1173701 RepID=A0A066WVQ3_COLSU|nr:hypothetical protein CSUB01_07605 [Colletotrichum sublineola]
MDIQSFRCLITAIGIVYVLLASQLSDCCASPVGDSLSLFAVLVKIPFAQPGFQATLDAGPLLVGNAEPGRVSASALDNHVLSANGQSIVLFSLDAAMLT